MQARNLVPILLIAFAFLALANFASAQGQFQVSSTTFVDNGLLPIRVIDFRIVATPTGFGNDCAPTFKIGGKQSPELSWTNIPSSTMYFAVTAFDTTAQVYHWGMYNIPLNTRRLPENAGVAESTFGQQVTNYSGNLGYIGPCPPRTDLFSHFYQFTVYAVRRFLNDVDLPSNSDAEALVNALAAPGLVLARASITGRWSSFKNSPP
jgi:Raf kinase inhibitor-like YbhB/YbcL family protein